jgi:lyso-ornithine lipid O-acyltransferase
MREWFRALWRFFYFITSTIIHIAGFAIRIMSGMHKKKAAAVLKRKWLSHVPAAMGIQIKVEGVPYLETCLYVANHISYIDPISILMFVEAHIVAKSEISKWPVIGLGGHIIGTIYVRRSEKSSRLKAAAEVTEALKNGSSILVFPEGTTSAGPQTLPFRPRSFEAASLAGVPVQPIAIKYDDVNVAFVGNHTFIPHFFRLFKSKKIQGHVIFGPLFEGKNTCDDARKWIDGRLSLADHNKVEDEQKVK